MSAEEIVVVKGPLHPDLFDGMTPIELVMTKKEAAQLKRKFPVTFETTATYSIEVEAENKEQARSRAWDDFSVGDAIAFGDYDSSIVSVEDDGPADEAEE